MPYKERIAPSFWIIENTWNHVCVQEVKFLVAFAKFLKTAISFVMCLSVCPSVHVEQLRLHTERIFMKFGTWLFRKSFEKIQLPWKSDKNNEQFTWRPMYALDRVSLRSS
jgi:hypothetical protein